MNREEESKEDAREIEETETVNQEDESKDCVEEEIVTQINTNSEDQSEAVPDVEPDVNTESNKLWCFKSHSLLAGTSCLGPWF